MKWLRRNVLQSVGTQSALTFAGAAVLIFVVAKWGLGTGTVTAALAAVVIGQLVVVGRIAHALRYNEFTYAAVRAQIDRPFGYLVSRFQGDDDAHPNAALLPGFSAIATVRDPQSQPESILDILRDPSELVVAAVDRTSGRVSLLSSIDGGRTLVSVSRGELPHERLVVNVADGDDVPAVIAAHQRAVVGRGDVVPLNTSPHHVVVDWLATRHRTVSVLGPLLSPFFDVESAGASPLRLVARITAEEIANLPVKLGPDLVGAAARTATEPAMDLPAKPVPPRSPESATVQPNAVTAPRPPESATVQPIRPIVEPEMVPPQMAAVDVAAVQMSTPAIVSMPTAVVAGDRVPAVSPAPETSIPVALAGDLAMSRESIPAPVSLDEAIMEAPDTAAALTESAPPEPDGPPFAGYASPTPTKRPRLSEVLRPPSESSGSSR